MKNTTIDINSVKTYFLQLQDRICHALVTEDGGQKFTHDEWQHANGGGGITRVLADGDVVEKGGVNFSYVKGDHLPASASAQRPELADCHFQATGVSLVIHPRNPYAPTSHMNVRLFVAEKAGADPLWWFGGGYDLTPYYGFEDDCIAWHTVAKAACQPFGTDIYPRYKKCCDDYFYLKHRQEPRGIGGLFFDDVNHWDFATCFEFIRAIGDSYLSAYQPILHKRKSMPYTQQEKTFQKIRRGRYVEFNLIYDRGTLFGLQSGGRTESILMSLPPQVEWHYDYQPEPGSKEAELTEKYLIARDWI